ncbi:MAG TPA: Na+/H+ antiporter NhaC family protein, partial [Bacillota bacterium]|nr:Na+/H+ antiporter NhaC family protein [Bacillota bacterium]
MDNTIWSLVPPILAIAMVLLTRRVLLSLGVGIVAAAFFIASFHFTESVSLIWESFKGVFVDEGALNTGNVFILIFILILGILTAFVSMMGGTKAFGDWMIKRVKTRAGAQIMTMILGIIIFIDDYFNS